MDKKFPLFIVTGASGSGKTYVVKELCRIMPDFDVFDPDQIVEFIGHDWEKIRNLWLRVARNIAQLTSPYLHRELKSGSSDMFAPPMTPQRSQGCGIPSRINQTKGRDPHHSGTQPPAPRHTSQQMISYR